MSCVMRAGLATSAGLLPGPRRRLAAAEGPRTRHRPSAPPRRLGPPVGGGLWGPSLHCAAAKPDSEVVETPEQRWELKFSELKEYKARWGHCSVVLGSSLGRWVYKQRELKEAGKLTKEQQDRLEAEGFDWAHPYDTQGGDWEAMYEELLKFKEQEGHCDVKKKYDKNPALGYWVTEQRIAYREKRLSPEVVERLNSVQFEWEARRKCGSKFMNGFRALVAFRDDHGHLDVPEDDPTYASIRTWMVAQRGARRKGNLSDKRIEYLDGLGFSWD